MDPSFQFENERRGGGRRATLRRILAGRETCCRLGASRASAGRCVVVRGSHALRRSAGTSARCARASPGGAPRPSGSGPPPVVEGGTAHLSLFNIFNHLISLLNVPFCPRVRQLIQLVLGYIKKLIKLIKDNVR